MTKENDCAFIEKNAYRSRKGRSQGCAEKTKTLKIKVGSRVDRSLQCSLRLSAIYFRPPFLPALRELDLLRFLPRPPPPFLRPPLSDLFTVAHARRDASFCSRRVSCNRARSSQLCAFASAYISFCSLVP